MKWPRQHFGDSGDDTHQLRHFNRLVAAAERADANSVMRRGVLGPRSSGVCRVLAKYVDQVEAVSGVVVVVELLCEQWRELLRVADILADSAALSSRHVGPGVRAVNLPVLRVIEATPELPRPLKSLFLPCADLYVEWRQ